MAGVIKGGKRPAADAAEEPEVAARARAVLEDAQRAADEVIAKTQAECAEIIAQAGAAGQQEGFSEAEHQREEIAQFEQRMLQEVEGEVVRTALRVASELLEAEMAGRADAVVDIVCTALATAKHARDVFLRVSPADVGVLRDHKTRLIDALGRVRDVEVREDRLVKRGGVLIQTESGVVDAQLETQLEEIARVLGA
jgi:flagellar biosynthesis/type III secretory pathway protein FliH